MNRAERRRAKCQAQKNPVLQYSPKRAREELHSEANAMMGKLKADMVQTAFTLMMALPLEVLMNRYWKKTYQKRLPKFCEDVLEYYEAWEDGLIDIEKLKEDLWEYGGVRLEERTEPPREAP